MRLNRLEHAREMIAMARLQPAFARALPDAAKRRDVLARMRNVTANVECPHTESQVLAFMIEVIALPSSVEGVIVEAGSFKGGSTAKLSFAAALAGRKLVVFDSFQGLPPNAEPHTESILGHSIEGWFQEGEFAGTLEEVRSNVENYGVLESCEFRQGWFDETMPQMDMGVCAAYLDVDLASSTRTCLKYLYPRLSPGGLLVSQDGDFPLVIEALRDEAFWEEEVAWPRPPMVGVGRSKIIKILKPLDAAPLPQPISRPS